MLQIRGVKGEAVVRYREPLTSLRQGFGPAGNQGDGAPSTFPKGKKHGKLNGIIWYSYLLISKNILELHQDPYCYCFLKPPVMFFIQR
jgi:hypothetical protein